MRNNRNQIDHNSQTIVVEVILDPLNNLQPNIPLANVANDLAHVIRR